MFAKLSQFFILRNVQFHKDSKGLLKVVCCNSELNINSKRNTGSYMNPLNKFSANNLKCKTLLEVANFFGHKIPLKYDARSYASEKKDCTTTAPKSGPDPCKNMPKSKEPVEKKIEYKSAWELPKNEDDCGFTQKDVLRYDMIHYDDSDKNKLYQKTWVDCPPDAARCVKSCEGEPTPPQFEKRPRGYKRNSACKVNPANISLEGKCPRIGAPCCRPARIPPKCIPAVPKMVCEKIETPYPAFSECSRDKPKPMNPRECDCLMPPSICEINANIDQYIREMKAKRSKQ